jgi:hypothetical protein
MRLFFLCSDRLKILQFIFCFKNLVPRSASLRVRYHLFHLSVNFIRIGVFLGVRSSEIFDLVLVEQIRSME